MSPHSAENGMSAASKPKISPSIAMPMPPSKPRVIPALPKAFGKARQKNPLRSVTPDKSADELDASPGGELVSGGGVGIIQTPMTPESLPAASSEPASAVVPQPRTPASPAAENNLHDSPDTAAHLATIQGGPHDARELRRDVEALATALLEQQLDRENGPADIGIESHIPSQIQDAHNPMNVELPEHNSAHKSTASTSDHSKPIRSPTAIMPSHPSSHLPHPSLYTLTFGGYADAQYPRSNGLSHTMPPPQPPPSFIPGNQYHPSQIYMMPSPSFGYHQPNTPSQPMSRDGSQASSANPTVNPSINLSAQEYEATRSVKDHVLAQYANPEFSDYELYVIETTPDSEPMILPIHSIIVRRSPTLLSLMKRKDLPTTPNGLKVITITLETKFMSIDCVVEGMRYLYGKALPSPQDLINSLIGPPNQRIVRALELAAAGHYLQLPLMAYHGIEMAKQLLRWDTMELALEFALDGGLDEYWQSQAFERLKFPENAHRAAMQGIEAPTFGRFASGLLFHIADFIRTQLPDTFTSSAFFKDAPQLSATPRLPRDKSIHPNTHHARSSGLQFGQLTAPPSGPDVLTSIISSTLVTLPFPVLKSIFESDVLVARFGTESVLHLMTIVLTEREARRFKLLRSQYMPEYEGTKWANALEYQERQVAGAPVPTTVGMELVLDTHTPRHNFQRTN